jgi:four helix bundle protein
MGRRREDERRWCAGCGAGARHERCALRVLGARARRRGQPGVRGFHETIAEENANMFDAYDVAVRLIRLLRPIVEQIQGYDRNLADQMRRAATSVVLNLAEGQRRFAGKKRRAYEIAHGEAREVLGCLDVAAEWGLIVDDRDARAMLDRLLAISWRLTHPRQAPQQRE